MLKRCFFWILLGSYWMVLTKSLLVTIPWMVLSRDLAENPPFDLSFEPISWLVHFFAYGFLGVLIGFVANRTSRLWIFLMALALIHGGVCEYLQSYIPGRWPNIFDFISNTTGLIMASVLHKVPGFENHHVLLNIFPKKPAT